MILLSLLTLILAASSANLSPLLERYVVEERWVDYASWRDSSEDRAALQQWIDQTVATDIFALERDVQIATWINLYNALTLDLILDHEPVASIKDIGGMITSAWEQKLVVVAGRELSLDDIEHKILRPDFQDPRIHFALNCASVSCPPLTSTPLSAGNLDARLDQLCLAALNDPFWFDASGCTSAYGSGSLRLSQLFDWFKDDFGGEQGVRAFIKHYRPELRFPLENTGCSLDYMDYDWSLNAPPES
ncbi:DUF547 domain-containing protein [bacterium]|nr:MAG: DUF547 domain-containing protein [bacterium]